MIDIIEAHWWVLGAALVLLVLLGWMLFGTRTHRASIHGRRPDVLDEGAAPARRNQALIDSPMAATIVPAVSVAPSDGPGEALAAAPPSPENAEALDWEGAERAEEAAATHEAVPASGTKPDDLRKLKGVGPKLVSALHALGITRYAQIAAWSEADIDRVDARLGSFAGRIRRDAWIEQARLLAGGDVAGFEARFGKVL